MKKAFEISHGEKQTCRDLLCLHADEYLGYENVRKIFTLPSREALCYKTFKGHYKRPKLVCVERDEEICSHQRKKARAGHHPSERYAQGQANDARIYAWLSL